MVMIPTLIMKVKFIDDLEDGYWNFDDDDAESHKQASQERTYQEYVATKSKEKISQMEQYYDQMISKAQNEITCILIEKIEFI